MAVPLAEFRKSPADAESIPFVITSGWNDGCAEILDSAV